MGRYLCNLPPRKTRAQQVMEAIAELRRTGHVACSTHINRLLPDMGLSHVQNTLTKLVQKRRIRVVDHEPGSYGGRYLKVYDLVEKDHEQDH